MYVEALAFRVETIHNVFRACFTSPHFHRFLLNKIAKIGENGGLPNNHAYK